MAACEFTVVVALPGEPEVFSDSFDAPVVAGRSENCDIRLPHPLVSRRHVEFGCTERGEVVVRDLESTNGTIVEDEVLKAASATLEGSARVQVGPYAIAVTAGGSPADTTMFAPVRAPAGAAAPTRRAPGDPLPDGLTEREVEVMRLVALGRSNPEIAEEFVLSVHTVTRHVSNIFDKTSTANRVELVRYAFERGLAD